MSIKIAIFASGSGTNAENIINYFRASSLIEVALVMSNKQDAYVLERARQKEIPSVVFGKLEMETSDRVLNILCDYQINFIVLAGFLLRVPDNILKAFPGKIMNIHPALLPKFGGKGMYGDRVHEAVIAAGEIESGITIHYINERYDEGDIIFQATCPILPGDTAKDVAEKIHELEYSHFPRIIEQTVMACFNK